MSWLLKLRKVPLIGWLVGIFAVLIALLIWWAKAASYRERQIRVNMQISSAKISHEKALKKIEEGNSLAREQVRAIQAAEIGKLEAKRTEIRKARKHGNQELAGMVNAMFKK